MSELVDQAIAQPVAAPPNLMATPGRLVMLDGWRATSIAMVLAGHLLPLGPTWTGANYAIPAMGMALFFVLSGFLITRFMVEHGDVRTFLIRRALRIIPLAWAGMIVAAIIGGHGLDRLVPNLAFVANIPPISLMPEGSHFWSLCVEAQFYAGIALLVAVGGQRALYLLPAIAIGVTATRMITGVPISIVTWLRVDEILAGAVLCLAVSGHFGNRPAAWLTSLNPYVLFLALLASCHPEGGWMAFLRPYLAALLVGQSLYAAPRRLVVIFSHRAVVYIAEISYALYVVHGLARHTWLGSGDTLERYLKRPLLFIVTFGVAHISTYHFEKHFMTLGKKLSRRRQ